MDEPRQAWEKVRALDTDVKYQLGPNTVDRYIHDPKRLGFMLARYKHAARFLQDCRSILDVGCSDGSGTFMFLGTKAQRIKGLDFDLTLIDHANKNLMPAIQQARPDDARRISFTHADIYDTLITNMRGISSLDCIEHLDPERADEFVEILHDGLTERGICVIGTPSKLAAQYQSEHSAQGHSNLYTPDELKAQMRKFFPTVWTFGLNDEVLHQGHPGMWHYILAVCVK